MDEIKTACQDLLPILAGLTRTSLTIAEFKVLMALKCHGALIASKVSRAIGSTGHNQKLLTDLTEKKLIDKLKNTQNKSDNHSRYIYSININGEIELKKALSEIEII